MKPHECETCKLNVYDCTCEVALPEECPFCGHNDVSLARCYDVEERRWSHVYCETCHAQGPRAETKAKAMQLWNKRHPTW